MQPLIAGAVLVIVVRLIKTGGFMKILMTVLFLGIGVVSAGIPQSIKEEMVSEDPQYREAFPLSPLSAVVVLHFPKAKLWVVTKIRMVAPDYWRFGDEDIEFIGREVDGELITLFEMKKQEI